MKYQNEILRIIKKGEQLDDEEIADLLQIPPFEASKILHEMEKAGLIVRISSGK